MIDRAFTTEVRSAVHSAVLWLALLMPGGPLAAQVRLALGRPDASSGSHFERIVAVRELRDGSVLLVDRGANALLHLESLSSTPRRIGRIDNEPGKYRTVGDLWSLGADTSLLTDQYTRRWLVLVGARIVTTISETRPANLHVRGTTEGADGMGRVVALRGHRFEPGAPRLEALADSYVVVRASFREGRIDSLAVVAGLGAGGYAQIPARGAQPNLFMPFNPLGVAEQVLLQPDGWLAVVRLSPYRVDWRRPDGSWQLGSPLPETRRPVTRTEQCAAIARLIDASWMRCEPSDFKNWPSEVPPVLWQTRVREATLSTLPLGRLAIARIPSLGDTRRTYDIVDRGSQRVGVLVLSAGEVLVGSSGRHAYVAHTDDDGLQSLRRYAWPPLLRGAAP
jgi:hypothetical protein